MNTATTFAPGTSVYIWPVGSSGTTTQHPRTVVFADTVGIATQIDSGPVRFYPWASVEEVEVAR